MSRSTTPSSYSGAYSPEFYDEIYFESGTMFGKSNYSHYHWMPELTFSLAMAIIEHTGLERGQRFLDFGCAKGFLVKAMRYLFRDAYGCDWSEYAIANAESDIRDCVRLSSAKISVPFDHQFDMCFSKDVLEHVPMEILPALMGQLRLKTKQIMVVVPLGDGEKYIIEEYERDKSHFIREDMNWWMGQIEKAGFSISSAVYYVQGIKENWYKVDPKGNAVIVAK